MLICLNIAFLNNQVSAGEYQKEDVRGHHSKRS
jgi:hypothetical protein